MSIKLDLSYVTKNKTTNFISIFNNVGNSLAQITGIPVKKKREKALIEIKKHANLSGLTQDTISLKNGDKKYTLVSKTPYHLRIIERGIKSKHVEKDITINNGIVISSTGLKPKDKSAENYINKILELFDIPILNLRKSFLNPKFVEFINSFKPPKPLNEYNKQLVNEIIQLFKQADNNITSVQNPQTRSGVKNGYSNIKLGILGSKQLEFIDINGKSYSVNILVDSKQQKNLVLGIIDKNGEKKHIIVEPDGKILKSKKINKRHDTGNRAIYYSENEVNSTFITESLSSLKNELTKYNKYIEKRIDELKIHRYKYSTTDIGTLKFAVLDKLIDIREKNNEIRQAYKWLKKEPRKIANEKLGINLGRGKNQSTIIKRVGPYNETLHLSFPVIDQTPCTKILILNRNNNVEKTYLIKGSNLIKFEAKDTSRSKWAKTAFHFHTQEEIDNSSLNIYIDELQTRLNEITEFINSNKNWNK